MRRIAKIVAVLAAIAVIVVGVSLFSLYEASQQVPAFYHEAISIDEAAQEPARDAFLAQATALASDLHRGGHWHTLFTAEQINAWLALELAKNYPDLLPEELRDPRISIRDREATIACRYASGDLSAVLSLTVEAYLPEANEAHLAEPNVLALRIRSARAGAIPVPLGKVLESIAQAARQLNLRLEWRKSHGDPLALISFPRPGRTSPSDQLSLEAVELRDGELFVSGTIGAGPPFAGPDEAAPSDHATASSSQAATETPKGDQPVVGAAEKETRQK